MRTYVDTSVLLRIVLGEPQPLREWRSITEAFASELIRVEALRTVDRARICLQLDEDAVAQQRSDLLLSLEGFHLARLDHAVLARAAEPFPTLVRTLDAIHLATALLLKPTYGELSFATHDVGLARAARSVGFRVLGV